jgi:cation transport ATPase
MSERRRNEKEEEKREKEDEKRQEKQMDEKFRRNPVRGIIFALILIWGGVVAFLETSHVVKASWWQAWAVFLAGTGFILLIKAAFRLMPEHRRPIGGTIVIGVVLLGVGLGDLIGWQYTWPVILIIFGIVLVGAVFFRRRR